MRRERDLGQKRKVDIFCVSEAYMKSSYRNFEAKFNSLGRGRREEVIFLLKMLVKTMMSNRVMVST